MMLSLFLLLAFAAWLCLGGFFLSKAKLGTTAFHICLIALVAALAARVPMLSHQTYDYIDFLSQWVQFFRDNGGFAALRQPIGDYNVPYLYFLAAFSYFPIPDLYLIKFLSLAFDLLLAFTGARLARRIHGPSPTQPHAYTPPYTYPITFAVLLLLPTVVLNGAYWGQCDSLYAALTLLALADALDNHPARSVVWLGIAFSFKLQTIFLIPLWCVLWYAKRIKFKHLCLFPLSYFVTILPALLLGRPLWSILGVYFNQAGQYHNRLTLNAPSIFALIPHGAEVDGDLLAKLGICAAFLLVFGLLAWLFCYRARLNDSHILTAALILAIGVPLFLPYMHDRYFFLADVLSVVWAVGAYRRAPVPACVQVASFGGYHAYLVLRYAFPMAWGAYLMLLALIAVTVSLGLSLRKNAPLGGEEFTA